MPARRPKNWLSRALSGRRPNAETDLEHCPACERDFAYPVEWEPVDKENWWMLLRCGECDSWREVTVPNAVAERFDLELDRRADVMHRALNKIDREQMIASANALIAALRHNLIDAADFAR
jgi:flavoprotein